MILKIDMSGDIPIYVQLRNEIVKGIGRGELAAGENLPTVRCLQCGSLLQNWGSIQ